MARNLMGCTTADVAVSASNGAVQPGSGPWPVYTTGPYRDTSVAITDLTDMAGNPVTQVTFGADGVLRYYSPDGDTRTHWLDVGQGLRIAVRPVSIVGPAGPVGPPGPTGPAIGALLTTKGDLAGRDGSAAVRVPVGTDGLALVADAASAPGVKWGQVGTGGLADSSVTTAKIKPGAVTPQQISGIGNLLTRNQAEPTTTGGWTLINASESSPGVFDATSTAPYYVREFVPVRPNTTYTLTVERALVGRPAVAYIEFRDANGNGILGASSGLVQPGGSASTIHLTATAPAGAVIAAIYPVNTDSGSVGDRATITKVSFHEGAGGVWTPPGLPIVGQSPIRHNGSYDLSGLGSPEGVRAAPVGARWTQTDSVTALGGIVVWRKRSGSGATGWQVVEGDTGTRNIAALLANGWTGTLSARRIGSVLKIWGQLDGGAATSQVAVPGASMPAGWVTSDGDNEVFATRNTASGALGSGLFGYGLSFFNIPTPNTGGLLFSASGLCVAAWPNVQIGT